MSKVFRFHPNIRAPYLYQYASFCVIALLCFLPPFAHAAYVYKEKPGAKDHPMVSRFKGSILENFGVINFEQVEVPIAPGKNQIVEGKVFNYSYVAPPNRGDLEVYRNFKQALQASRFKIILACEDAEQCQRQGLAEHASRWSGDSRSFEGAYSPISRMDSNDNYPPRFLVARLARVEGDVTVVLTVKSPSSTQKDSGVGGPYFLQVIESGAMQAGNVTINADALGKGLSTEGKIAIYGVYFDTGKAEIKSESKAQLDEMAKYLSQDKTTKFFVIGHTDNQGVLDANLALSQKRAEAVTAALVSTYKIDVKRLYARGIANFSPVASNVSEPGRTKNRRVELVTQ